jgi:integrase/recombinase XerD
MLDWKSSINGFMHYLQLERAMSPNSIDAYIRDISKFHRYLQIRELELNPAEIEENHLMDFIVWLNELGLGPKSQARIRSGVKAYYRYLLLEDMIEHDPSELIESPKLARKIPEVLSINEIQSILDSVDLSTDHGTRNRALLEVLYACGLRVSELTHLKISNMYADIGFIKVLGKGDKERLVPIGEEALKHIQFYMDGVRRHLPKIQPLNEDFIFLNRRGRKLSRVMIFMIVKDAAKDAGIEKNVSPHTFRHSFATHLVEGGADLKAVQDMLGHESITTTEIYTHLDNAYLRNTILAHHPLNKK